VSEREPIEEPAIHDTLSENQNGLKSKMRYIAKEYKTEIELGIAILSALITLTLVGVTCSQLNETKYQRELAHRQFVLANHPSISINANEQLELKENMATFKWEMINSGGTVKNIKTKCILLIQDNKEKSIYHSQMRQHYIYRLDRGHYLHHSRFENPDTINFLKNVFEKGDSTLIIYLRSDFEIPPEITVNKIAQNDHFIKIFVWIKKVGRFEGVTEESFKSVSSYVEEKGYLALDKLE